MNEQSRIAVGETREGRSEEHHEGRASTSEGKDGKGQGEAVAKILNSERTEYNSWVGMHQRCTNPKNNRYHQYGGRGIKVCERWNSFVQFFEDMGEKPSAKHSIDRINNDGNYEPSNCQWLLNKKQHWNKTDNKMLTIKGETMCLAAWSERSGVCANTIGNRLEHGKTHEEAVFMPPKQRKQPKQLREALALIEAIRTASSCPSGTDLAAWVKILHDTRESERQVFIASIDQIRAMVSCPHGADILEWLRQLVVEDYDGNDIADLTLGETPEDDAALIALNLATK